MPMIQYAVGAFLACYCVADDAATTKVEADDPRSAQAVEAFAAARLGTTISLHDDGSIRSLYVSRADYSPELFKRLRGLTNLEYLCLNGPQITDEVLPHLSGLNRLNRLNLGSARFSDAGRSSTNITGTGLFHLKGMTKLEYLLLGKTEVRGAGLAQLAAMHNLRKLYLHASPVTDTGIPHLAALKRLEWAGLGGTKVTDDGVKKLQVALPDCRVGR